MKRIEVVRKHIDEILLNVPDNFMRRCGYLHLYGVSQACTMIAMKRNEDVELATIAGMLHDIYTYAKMDSKDHAQKGAIMAKEILVSMKLFDEKEINLICNAIHNHSDKTRTHSSFSEVLIDADVLQHCLYNPYHDIATHEVERFQNLKIEFGF
jgi:HD superfamily phosphodiesterase